MAAGAGRNVALFTAGVAGIQVLRDRVDVGFREALQELHFGHAVREHAGAIDRAGDVAAACAADAPESREGILDGGSCPGITVAKAAIGIVKRRIVRLTRDEVDDLDPRGHRGAFEISVTDDQRNFVDARGSIAVLRRCARAGRKISEVP